MSFDAEPGDEISMGDGRSGMVVKISDAGVFTVAWNGGGRTKCVPDSRSAEVVERQKFARLVAEAEQAAGKLRSDAARRGWETRRATATVGIGP